MMRDHLDKVELIRETCATWSEGNLDATLGLIDPDARWEPSGRFIGAGEIYEGHEGVQRFWAVFREPWRDIGLEPVEFTEVDESRVLTRTHFRGVGRSSGVVTETELFVVWTVECGKVTRYQSFGDRLEALDAAGLSE
jgi:ketosteroid isomerase-like protein